MSKNYKCRKCEDTGLVGMFFKLKTCPHCNGDPCGYFERTFKAPSVPPRTPSPVGYLGNCEYCRSILTLERGCCGNCGGPVDVQKLMREKAEMRPELSIQSAYVEDVERLKRDWLDISRKIGDRVAVGVMTVNEARRVEGLDEI